MSYQDEVRDFASWLMGRRPENDAVSFSSVPPGTVFRLKAAGPTFVKGSRGWYRDGSGKRRRGNAKLRVLPEHLPTT